MKIIINSRRPHCIHLRGPLKFKPGYYHDPRMRRNNIMRRTKNGVLDEHCLRRKNFYFSLQARISRTTGFFFVCVHRLARNHSFHYFISLIIWFFRFFFFVVFLTCTPPQFRYLTRRYYTNSCRIVDVFTMVGERRRSRAV